MNKRYWLIRGHNGFKSIFEKKVALGQFTDDQIRHLLQALAAKAGLTFVEMVGAYAKRRTTIATDLLAVHKDLDHPTYTCGCDPKFTATVVDESGKFVVRKKRRAA